ncbi:hypothetical protein [Lysinibacillus odysseyi]|uniref:hypothetical protein n=1 Tax=Lysinibacillus odysseyi TaxID=202611 RepID=UPI00117C7A1C|nr:hypothetical protein [Lysinibacillus odysseyi]
MLHKATLGNGNLDTALLDISDLRVDAQTLANLHSQAESTGPLYDDNEELAGFPKARQYAALKAKFEAQQAAANAFDKEPCQSHDPAITTQSIKPINA